MEEPKSHFTYDGHAADVELGDQVCDFGDGCRRFDSMDVGLHDFANAHDGFLNDWPDRRAW